MTRSALLDRLYEMQRLPRPHFMMEIFRGAIENPSNETPLACLAEADADVTHLEKTLRQMRGLTLRLGSEISDLLAKLERERASAKTLKRLRRVLSGRLWQTFNTPPVATWMPVAILVETPAWLNNEQQEEP